MASPLRGIRGEGGDDDASTPGSDGAHQSHSEASAEHDDGSDVASNEDDEDDDVDGEGDGANSDCSMDAEDDELPENFVEGGNGSRSDDESAKGDSEDDLTQSAQAKEGASNSSLVKLGGPNSSNGVPAYALLAGMIHPNVSDSREIISIPITRLPTSLGKEHATKDPSFVGLKELSSPATNNDVATENASYLSQSMCCIFYRDSHGGKLGLYRKGRRKESDNTGDNESGEATDPLNGMIYKPREHVVIDDNDKPSLSSDDDLIRLPGMDPNSPLPSSGFFAIECTGRKIIVGGRAMKKGQVAMLGDGMPIRIASYCFYFLLPRTTSTKPQPSIKVKLAAAPQPTIKPEMVASSGAAVETKDSKGSAGSGEGDDDSTASRPPAKKLRKSEDPPALKSATSSLDDKSDVELLSLLSEKVAQSSWDHEGQRIGSLLAMRACRAAAESHHIKSIVRDEGGVTQREIIDWMNEPDNVFRNYETMMLEKIVEKSFMMSVGKAIVRAGYSKNEGLSGRAFRWNLPADVTPLGEEEWPGQGLSKEEGANDDTEEGGGLLFNLAEGIEEEDVDDFDGGGLDPLAS